MSLILMCVLSHPRLHPSLPGAALLYPNGVSALTVWLVNFDLQTLQASRGEELASPDSLVDDQLASFQPKTPHRGSRLACSLLSRYVTR